MAKRQVMIIANSDDTDEDVDFDAANGMISSDSEFYLHEVVLPESVGRCVCLIF